MENLNNVYIGERYVPKIMGTWDETIPYEGLCIVYQNGNSYISRKPVPAGTPITNTEYWALFSAVDGQISSVTDRLDTLDDEITNVNNQINTINTNISTINGGVWTSARSLGMLPNTDISGILSNLPSSVQNLAFEPGFYFLSSAKSTINVNIPVYFAPGAVLVINGQISGNVVDFKQPVLAGYYPIFRFQYTSANINLNQSIVKLTWFRESSSMDIISITHALSYINNPKITFDLGNGEFSIGHRGEYPSYIKAIGKNATLTGNLNYNNNPLKLHLEGCDIKFNINNINISDLYLKNCTIDFNNINTHFIDGSHVSNIVAKNITTIGESTAQKRFLNLAGSADNPIDYTFENWTVTDGVVFGYKNVVTNRPPKITYKNIKKVNNKESVGFYFSFLPNNNAINISYENCNLQGNSFYGNSYISCTFNGVNQHNSFSLGQGTSQHPSYFQDCQFNYTYPESTSSILLPNGLFNKCSFNFVNVDSLSGPVGENKVTLEHCYVAAGITLDNNIFTVNTPIGSGINIPIPPSTGNNWNIKVQLNTNRVINDYYNGLTVKSSNVNTAFGIVFNNEPLPLIKNNASQVLLINKTGDPVNVELRLIDNVNMLYQPVTPWATLLGQEIKHFQVWFGETQQSSIIFPVKLT